VVTRDLKLGVEVTGAAAAERDLNRVGKAADDLGDELKDSGEKAIRAGLAYRDASGKLRNMQGRFLGAAGAAKLLAGELDDVADAAKRAARETDGIGGPSLGSGGGGKSMAGGFMGFFGDVVKTGTKAGAETASTFAAAFQGGIMSAFKSLPAPAQAGIVAGVAGAIVAGAPLIASAFSGALLLGVGGGGLAAGIALAVKDSQVQRAFAGLGEHLTVQLQDAAKPFRAELVDASRIFGAAFDKNAPQIRATFAALSKAVQPLARGLSGLVTNALPGIRRAAEAAVPLFKELAKEMPRLGKAVSMFFDSIADAGPGAIATFKFLLLAVGALIVEFGFWLKQMGQIAAGLGVIVDIMMPGSHATEEFGETWATAMSTVSTSTGDARREAQKFKVDLDALFGQQMSAREAAIAYEQAIDDLAESFRRGSGALDINTQKGRDNLGLVNDTINAAREQLRAETEAANGDQAAIAAANARYQAQLQRLREVLTQLGLNEQQINDLIGIAAQIPRDIAIDVSLIGARSAAGQLQGLAGAIAAVRGAGGSAIGAAARVSIKRRASGGPVTAGEPYIVGERRPEVFVPNASGRILPSVPAAMGSGSGGARPVNIVYSGGTPSGLEAMFLSWLMKKARTGELQLAG
jgi:hypothetical protein